jgi:hypothetical protein
MTHFSVQRRVILIVNICLAFEVFRVVFFNERTIDASFFRHREMHHSFIRRQKLF